MKICILGDTHAPKIMLEAARKRGFSLCLHYNDGPDIIFISEDAVTFDDGKRDLTSIEKWCEIIALVNCPIVITSQVEPGFMRRHGLDNVFHLIETLRIIDAQERADNPEMHVIGCADPTKPLPVALQNYLDAWPCPKFRVTYEEAEFTKIAINTFLAAQVDTTNRLAAAAARIGANWEKVAQCLRWDKRIGQHAYLKPGRWQDSRHLLRDAYTLERL